MIRLILGAAIGYVAAPFVVAKLAPTQKTLSADNVKIAGAIAGATVGRFLL